MDIKEYANYLVNWIRDEVLKSGFKGVVVGISGGIDSAVVVRLAQLAFPTTHLGIVMPCHSSKLDFECAMEIINQHKINYTICDLSNTYDQLTNIYNRDLEFTENKLALANIKPRLRMTTLYAYAQSRNALVLGTDNADEWYIGYFTKFGDGGVDLLPIVHLRKKDVRDIAEHLDVPISIIKRQPSAGLWDGQTDENELGFSYDELDNYLTEVSVPSTVSNKIEHLHKISVHKRSGAKQPDKQFVKLLTK